MKPHLSSKLAPLELSRVLSFSLPALGAVLNDPLMSLVDTACVGQVSSIGLAALGPNTSIFGFASMVFHFLTVASTVQVSRAHDKNDLANKSQCISDALSLALLCGVLSSVFLIACGGTLLRVMFTPPELMVPAQNYLTIRSFALPATLVTLVGTAACLGQRDARTPLNIALATGTLNLLTNLFLVLGPPNMGILGSALATVASAWCGATLFCIHLLRGPLHLSLRVPTAKRAEPFISAGSVLIIRSVCVMLCYSLATSAASAMGTLTLAGHQVLVGVMTVAQFCPEPLSSCAQASLASVGARSVRGEAHAHEMLYTRRTIFVLLSCSAVLGLGLSLLCCGALVFFPHVFTFDSAVIMATRSLAPVLSACVAFYTPVCVMDGILYASGKMVFSAATQASNHKNLFSSLLTAIIVHQAVLTLVSSLKNRFVSGVQSPSLSNVHNARLKRRFRSSWCLVVISLPVHCSVPSERDCVVLDTRPRSDEAKEENWTQTVM